MNLRLIGITINILLCFACSAQEKSIFGIVKSAEDGSFLEGASINVLHKPHQTLTDKNGEFKINASVGDTIVFSFVGRKPQREIVGTKMVLEVVLYSAADPMDEVTVVAFGKQKKESVVGAITTINTKDLRIPSSNLTSAFAGRIPGVVSYQTSGEPGADNAQFLYVA